MNRRMRTLYASLEAMSPGMQLAEAHTQKPKGLRIQNVSADTTELYVYGEIGGGWFGGINAADFMNELKAVATPNLTVRISSPGGDVFEAVAMHTALKNFAGTVTTVNDAIAASAASFLAMAGDNIRTEQGAMWMLHAASTLTHGTAADHRDSADLLDKVSHVIAEFYALRAGGEISEWLELLNSGDNWYTADEALELGITDEIVSDQAEAKVNARLRYVLAQAPKSLLAHAPEVPIIDPNEPAPRLILWPMTRMRTTLPTSMMTNLS